MAQRGVTVAGGNESSADDDDEEDDKEPEFTPQEGMDLCRKLEKLCLQYTDVDGFDVNGLQHQLRKLCSHLRKTDLATRKQTTLHCFFTSTSDIFTT
jgi:hypothetical protein